MNSLQVKLVCTSLLFLLLTSKLTFAGKYKIDFLLLTVKGNFIQPVA